MGIRARRPVAPLSEVVNTLWLFDGDAQHNGIERALPDGCLQLIVNLREDRFRLYDCTSFRVRDTCDGCLIVGPRSEFSVIETPSRMSLAGIHFKPGGAYSFLAPPISELRGIDLPLDTLWNRFASELRVRLLEAESADERFCVMEQMLLARAIRPLAPEPAIAFALDRFERRPCTQTIADVTGQTGFSSRVFIELFRRHVGLTPKLFCRVRRFQRALQLVAAGRSVRWTDVAMEAGYFDQAHFVHDFRAFSGINPTQYRDAQPWHPNHVPLAGT